MRRGPLRLEEFEDPGAVLLDPRVAHPGDLLQGGLRGGPRLDNLRELFVGEDRVDGDSLALRNLFTHISQPREDGELFCAQDLLVVNLETRSRAILAGAAFCRGIEVINAKQPERVGSLLDPPSVD